MTKDYLGNELVVGDVVILVRPNYRDLRLATITKISSTGRTVYLEYTTVYLEYTNYSKFTQEVKQEPHQLIKYFKPTTAE